VYLPGTRARCSVGVIQIVECDYMIVALTEGRDEHPPAAANVVSLVNSPMEAATFPVSTSQTRNEIPGCGRGCQVLSILTKANWNEPRDITP